MSCAETKYCGNVFPVVFDIVLLELFGKVMYILCRNTVLFDRDPEYKEFKL